MFMKDDNGNRIQVRLNAREVIQPAVITENYEKSAGSNKMLLYIALFIGLAVAVTSGYMLLTSNDDKKIVNRKNFGYRLYK
jgi:hypothetical protein